MKKKILRIILFPLRESMIILTKMIIFWPTTNLGNFLREWFYKRDLRFLGDNPKFESGVRFGQPDTVEIGNNCILGRNVNINAGHCNGVYIGNYVAMTQVIF